MILDPATASPGRIYQTMISVVVPRPIAFVSTVGAGGGFNLAPFSYFNAISSAPPLVGIAINDREAGPKDTLRNIRETGDFVVNVVNEALAARMVRTSGDWPRDVDEFAITGLTAVPSERVRSPRLGESPVNLECRLHQELRLGSSCFVVGEVVWAHIRDEVLTDGKVDPEKLKPVGRLGGEGYAPLREVLRLPRPRVGPDVRELP